MTSPRPFVAVLLLVASCGSDAGPADCNGLAEMLCERTCECSLATYSQCVYDGAMGARGFATKAACLEQVVADYDCGSGGWGRVSPSCAQQIQDAPCIHDGDLYRLALGNECLPECVAGRS